jgi:lipoate-protein ligase A
MILWCDGAHPPDENMRRDDALLASFEAAGEGRSEPVLRLFRFAPHGVTLGRSQRPADALDLDRCRADRVPWAVRPTGGRAIFHAEEWTYSLTASIADPDWGGSLGQAYERAGALLLRSLLRLGVPAALVPRPTRGGPGEAFAAGAAGPVSVRGAAAACFASTARHEIVLGGRKLVGSAQRRGAHALLQQGSVLLGAGHVHLADYLALPESGRDAARRGLAVSAAHAGGILGEPPLERWADALMAELPPGTRRLDGASGAHLLTLPEPASYTPHS